MYIHVPIVIAVANHLLALHYQNQYPLEVWYELQYEVAQVVLQEGQHKRNQLVGYGLQAKEYM